MSGFMAGVLPALLKNPQQRLLEICAAAYPLAERNGALLVQADNSKGSMRISHTAYFVFLRNAEPKE